MLGWVSEFLISKEYTYQINALKIAGVLFGFNLAIEEEEELNNEIFQHLNYLIPSTFWDVINKLQYHQNRQIHLMAMCIFQLCMPKKEVQKFITQHLELLSHQSQDNQSLFQGSSTHQSIQSEQDSILWMQKLDQEKLGLMIQIIFSDNKSQENEQDNLDKVLSEEQEISVKEVTAKVANKMNFLDDDPLDFDELGIIEVDDEEWNEYDDLRKVPILKGKIKNISPQIASTAKHKGGNEEDTLNEHRWSGKRRPQVQKKAQEDKQLKLLRPHNPLFRPLTPPIGSHQIEIKSELENNMELFQNYVLLNPDGFQKIMDEIKNKQQQEKIEVEEVQSFQEFEQLDRKVDELEFDPLFVSKKKENEEVVQEKKQEIQQIPDTSSQSLNSSQKKNLKKKKKKQNQNSKSQKMLIQNQNVKLETLSYKDLKDIWSLQQNYKSGVKTLTQSKQGPSEKKQSQVKKKK